MLQVVRVHPGAGQVGLNPEQVGPGQVGPGQVGSVQDGLGQVGPAQITKSAFPIIFQLAYILVY